MRVKTNKIPPPIPGLRYWADSGTADGPVCAMSAAGLYAGKRYTKPSTMVPPEHVDWRKYQREGIEQIVSILMQHKGAILADDTGLGKTPQGAAVASMLGKSTLIVSPAGVRHQWREWMMRMTEGDMCAVLGPPSDGNFDDDWAAWKDKRALSACVSYQLMEQALKARIPGTLLLDEPHSFLQGRANTYVKPLWKYGGAIQYKLALTATPYLSRPAGLWQLLNILLGYAFGKAREFDIRYCNGHQGQWGFDRSGATNIEELSHRLSFYMVRRMKAEVAKDLPKVTRTVRWIDADAKATAALAMAPHTIAGLRGAIKPTLKGKLGAVHELMRDAPGPTTIFTWMKEDAYAIAEDMAEQYDIRAITGDEPPHVRATMVESARAAGAHVVTTYGASGQGLDGLQKWIANVIYHAIDPVPAVTLQASGRHDRIGQTMPVTETFLAMRDSVDELTVDKVITKLDVWQSVMGKDASSAGVRNALVRGGLDVNDDAVLDAIFKEMSK